MITEFTFNQKTTNIVSLVETVTKVLELARSRVSQMENMQLVFIISDGRFADRQGLKQWIRDAEDRNMFLVFIIVDNPKNKDSILELKVKIDVVMMREILILLL